MKQQGASLLQCRVDRNVLWDCWHLYLYFYRPCNRITHSTAGQKNCDWLRDLHRARRLIIQDRADPGEKQTLEAKVELWQAGQPWSGSWFAAGAWKRPAARSCVALGWLISTSQHFSCPDKTIITSAEEQVFWLFRQHRGKYESTELLERFTGRVDSK